MSRLPPLDPNKLDPEQRRVYDAIASGPRGGVRGPFLALLHVPELADRVQHLGEHLRYQTCFPPRLSELAILIIARHYTCQYEWLAHESHARRAGVTDDVIESLRANRSPAALEPDESAVHGFVSEILRGGKVSDPTYDAITKRFGVRGAVELTGLVGYYTFLAFTLLAHDVPLPDGVEPPMKG